jgi:hypothetical protein
MPQDSDTELLGLEVTFLYLALKRALDGASPRALQSGLAMSLVLAAEGLGHAGEDVGVWIDETATKAKAALDFGQRRRAQ